MPIIPAAWESEAGGSELKASPDKVNEMLSQKKYKSKG
jgi:hypothetical protein